MIEDERLRDIDNQDSLLIDDDQREEKEEDGKELFDDLHKTISLLGYEWRII